VTGATYTQFGNRGLGEGGWGMSDREHAEFDVEDFATGLIKFANGATVSLDVSWACHAADSNRNDVHLYGSEGGAQCYPAMLFRYAADGVGYTVEQELRRAIPYSTDRFHNFINHLLEREDLCVTPHQALVVQRILDAVQQSCQTGREVRFD
jgi:predicted dehydrogenase